MFCLIFIPPDHQINSLFSSVQYIKFSSEFQFLSTVVTDLTGKRRTDGLEIAKMIIKVIVIMTGAGEGRI